MVCSVSVRPPVFLSLVGFINPGRGAFGQRRRPHLAPSIDTGVREYPVAALFLRDVLERLGRHFIVVDGEQAVHLLTVMTARPTDADMLRPYFSPAQVPAQFTGMYSSVGAERARWPYRGADLTSSHATPVST